MELTNVAFVHVRKDSMDENVNVIQHHQRLNQNSTMQKVREKNVLKIFLRVFVFSRPGSTDICSGRGQCVCGRCKCETATIEVRAK